MRVIEIESIVDKEGKLTIPANLLGDMGLVSGDTVKLAYISKSNDYPLNTYSKFMLTPNGIAAIEETEIDFEGRKISVPHELLEAANIPCDTDIEVVCTDGAIIITAADPLEIIPDELGQLFAELGISPETVRSVLMNGGVSDERQ